MEFKLLRDVIREHVLAVITAVDGNIHKAARTLGISVTGLRYRLRSYQKEGFEIPASQHRLKMAGKMKEWNLHAGEKNK